MINVWFNHWFSTSYYFMESLKKFRSDIKIIASSENEDAVYKLIADEFYVEPAYNRDTYLDYCINFCKEHDIDVFFCRRCTDLFVGSKEFGKTKIICMDDLDLFSTLNSKFSTAEWFKENITSCVPEIYLCNTVDEFIAAYNTLSAKGEKVCIKLDKDEGGMSYKLIEDRPANFGQISTNNGMVFSFDYTCNCLKEMTKPIVVMPYLSGKELSIDCIGTKDGLVAVERTKTGRITTLNTMPSEALNIAQKFYNKTKMQVPFNIQFRYHNDKLYLLEVNTRLTGGSYQSREIGVDFVVIAFCNAMDIPYEVKDWQGKTIRIEKLEGYKLL